MRCRAIGLLAGLFIICSCTVPLFAQEPDDISTTGEQVLQNADDDLWLLPDAGPIVVEEDEPEMTSDQDTGSDEETVLTQEEFSPAEDAPEAFTDQLLALDSDEVLPEENSFPEDQLPREADTEEPESVSECVLETEFEEPLLLASSETVLYSGTWGDNLRWELTGTGQEMTLTISGEGKMCDETQPWYAYRNRIVFVIIEEGVTNIRRDAFKHHTAMTQIQIPDSVSYIGSKAFYMCAKLESITIPAGVACVHQRTFMGCSALQAVDFPDSVTNISHHVFCDCVSLRTVHLPAKLSKLGYRAFENCAGLEEISIPGTVREIKYLTFPGCSSLKTVHFSGSRSQWLNLLLATDGNYDLIFANVICDTDDVDPNIVVRGFFSGGAVWELIRDGGEFMLRCSGKSGSRITKDRKWAKYGKTVTKLVIEEGITCLEDQCFKNCQDLETVSFSGSITKIGIGAFEECQKLREITLPAGLISLGYNAFSNCKGLTSVYFQKSIQDIYGGAFYGCTNLTTVSFPPDISMNMIGLSTFAGCTKLRSLELPAFVYDFSSAAFLDCSSIKQITLPRGSYRVSDRLFGGCSALTSITLPYGITQIEKGAAENCSSLSRISIPASVEIIGESAFTGCDALSDVYFGGDQQQWNSISMGKGNECLTDARIHFQKTKDISSAQITLSHTVLTYNGEYRTPEPVVTLAGKTLTEGTDYEVTYRNNKKVGTALVIISGIGKNSGSDAAAFRIRPRKTSIKSLKGGPRAITVTWSKRITQNEGYHIQCSVNRDFYPLSGRKTKNFRVYDTETVSKTCIGLNAGRKYYVRIRCFKRIGERTYYSKWSDVETVKTQ